MELTVLPKDLKIGESKPLQLYNYRQKKDLEKTKINLSRHTISFLRSGKKEVIGDDETVYITNQRFVVMKAGNCLMTEKVSDEAQVYQSILLFFSDEAILSFLDKNPPMKPKSSRNKSFFIYNYDDFIQNFVASLVQIMQLPIPLQEKMLRHKFEEIDICKKLLYQKVMFRLKMKNT